MSVITPQAPSPETSGTEKASSPPGLLPAKVFYAYRRGLFGRKHFFTEVVTDGGDNDDNNDDVVASAEEEIPNGGTTNPPSGGGGGGGGGSCYYIMNPVPQKHANTWLPVFWRGDNPKHCPDSTRLGLARRTGFWNAFRVQLGDGVQGVVRNKQRRAARRKHERIQRLRRWFCMKEKPPKKPLEEQQDVDGLVMAFGMYRPMGVARTLRWELGGEKYTWKGTRTFLRDFWKGWKGVSHDLKLVNSEGTLIATFEKERWASFKWAEKVGTPPNKQRTLLGKLRIFPCATLPSQAATGALLEQTSNGNIVAEALDKSSGNALKKKMKEDKVLNLGGTHTGNLLEEAIVFTCWMAIEGEHRLRWKLLDIVEEIAETAGG